MESANDRVFIQIAEQLGFVSPEDLRGIYREFGVDESGGVADRLVAVGQLSPSHRGLVDSLVKRTISLHGGDAENAAKTLSGRLMETLSLEGSGADRPAPGGHVSSPAPAKPSAGNSQEVLTQEVPGRYTVLGQQSRGGMGRILIAYDADMGREIALKELLPKGSDLPGMSPHRPLSRSETVRFLREARITGQLEHPSIVPVYELGHRADRAPYYAMRFVRGRSLSQALAACVSLEDRLALLPRFLDLCQAIAYAHSRGVIHRDIKPSNVMVGEFGETVVIDWGLAKATGHEDIHADTIEQGATALRLRVETDGEATLPGDILGTPVYMSPEQARGDVSQVDERSDIYSLGTILYEIMAGHVPFTAVTASEVLTKVTREEPPPLEHLQPDAPPELIAVCRRAMDRETVNRYPSANDLAEEIHRFQTGQLVSAHRYRFSDHLYRFAKRHRAILLTAFIALIGLAVFGVVSYRQVFEERGLAERELYYSSVLLADHYAANLQRDEATTVLARAPERFRNWEWGRLLSDANPEYLALDGESAAINKVCLSSDGGLLAAGSNEGVIRVWRTQDGRQVHRLKGGTETVYGLAFSPDSRWLASAGGDTVLRLWDVATGTLIQSFPGHENEVNTVAFSPDGALIASGADDGTARVWGVETGEELAKITADPLRVSMVAFVSGDGALLTANSDSATITEWDWRTGTVLRTFAIGETGVENAWGCFAVSPDQTLLAAAGRVQSPSGDDNRLPSDMRLWDLRTGELLHRFTGHEDTVWDLAFSPDGRRLAGALLGGQIPFWNLQAAQPAENVYRISRGALSVAYHPDSTRIVSSGDESTIRVWIDPERMPPRTYPLPDSVATNTKWAVTETHLAYASGETLYRVDRATGDVVHTVDPQVGVIVATEFSPDRSLLGVAGKNGLARVLELETDREVLRVEERDWILAFAFSPDSRYAITAGGPQDPPIDIWDLETGQLARSWDQHQAAVDCLRFSPDGNWLAAGLRDGTVHIWDFETGEELMVLDGHRDTVGVLAFTPDGKQLATGGPLTDRTIALWDLTTGHLRRRLVGHDTGLMALRYTPDGKRLIGGDNQVIIVWEPDTGRELLRLRFRQPFVLSPDGRTLFATDFARDTLHVLPTFPWESSEYPGNDATPFADRLAAFKRAYRLGQIASIQATPESSQPPR